MKSSSVIKGVFVYLLILQTVNIIVGPEFHSILFFKFTLFEIGMIAVVGLLLIKLFLAENKFKDDVNRVLLFVIVILFLYQVVVVAPLLLLDGYTPKEMVYAIFRRSYLLSILLFYWYLLPAFKDRELPVKLINYCGLLLFAAFIIAYVVGQRDYTSTGELRIAPGVATIIFAFMLITNFSLYSQKKTNLFFVAVALSGLVFSNHKSAYFALLILTILAVINFKRYTGKSKLALHLVLLFLFVMIPLSQIPFLAENFTGRVSSSFTMKDPNAEDRVVHYDMAWKYFLDNPINGSKTNTRYYHSYIDDGVPPHSFTFQILATQGIVGFAAMFLIIGMLLWIGYKNRRDPMSFQMFLVILFYFIFTNLNENFFDTRNILMLTFSAALLLDRNRCIENAKAVLIPELENNHNESLNSELAHST